MFTKEEFEAAEVTVAARLAAGTPLDEVIALLRAEGAGQIDAMKLILNTTDLGLARAKLAVDSSSAWRDQREANEILRRELHNAVQAIADAPPAR